MQHFKISEKKKTALLKGSTFKIPRFYYDYLFLYAICSTLESDEKTDDIIQSCSQSILCPDVECHIRNSAVVRRKCGDCNK